MSVRSGVVIVAVTALATAAHAEGSVPTFGKDVAPVLDAHCVSCHRPGEVAAAEPLVSYDSAKSFAAATARAVATRAMPPWPADPDHSLRFSNDPRLTQAEIDTLVAWAQAGAPRGEVAAVPPPPGPPPKWLHPEGRPPDAVLRLPDVSVAASGEIPYVQQRVKVPLTTDKWITAMQVVPGNPGLVHHMGITEVSLADGMNGADLDALAKVARQMGLADDALMNIRPAVMDTVDSGAYDMLGVYTPGSTFEMYQHDSAKLLKAGTNMYINFNIHYTTTGKPEKSHSELALWFQSETPQHQLFRAPSAVSTLIANGRQLLSDDPGTKAEGTDFAIPPIAPNDANYELIGITAYVEPITIFQLQPHAHMRGKDFKYAVVYPDGHEVTVLTVPKYDFHWQLAYDLATPLRVPAGGKLVVTAHYDNSPGNKHLSEVGVDPQNCGPDKEAYFRKQNQSWHEMFSPLIQYSVDDGNASRVKLVETVGCLDTRAGAAAANAWVLARASTPVVTRTQSTSAAALRANAAIPLGEHSYQLLGVDLFAPALHEKHRVAVKGVLIHAARESRLNVTSLEALPGACS
jgi:hypothetical protein